MGFGLRGLAASSGVWGSGLHTGFGVLGTGLKVAGIWAWGLGFRGVCDGVCRT